MNSKDVDWEALMRDLFRIYTDETETPRRRRIARRAYELATEGSGPMRAISVGSNVLTNGHGPKRTPGGMYQRTEMLYDGYTT